MVRQQVLAEQSFTVTLQIHLRERDNGIRLVRNDGADAGYQAFLQSACKESKKRRDILLTGTDLLSRVALSKEKLTSHMLCTGMGISKPVVSLAGGKPLQKGISGERDVCSRPPQLLSMYHRERAGRAGAHLHVLSGTPVFHEAQGRRGDFQPSYGADTSGKPSGRGIRGNKTVTEICHSGSRSFEYLSGITVESGRFQGADQEQ